MTVLIPVRDFSGMSRLETVLAPELRTALSRWLCKTAVSAAQTAGLDVIVVSSSPEVREWTHADGIETWPDPGTGLSAAMAEAVGRMGANPWIALHADLPLLTAAALTEVARQPGDRTVLVPSHDGGTNVIRSSGAFPFSYGPGSFHRHFAAAPNAVVISRPELSIDIDSPAQLAVFPKLISRLSPTLAS